jgi:hypothetical protein
VARFENERLCPNFSALPHLSHFAIFLSFLGLPVRGKPRVILP